MSKSTNMREINIMMYIHTKCIFSFKTQSLNLTTAVFFLFVGQILQISTKFVLGNVIFSWQPLDYSAYYVQITRDTTSDTWARVNSTHYTVRDVLLYDSISINVRTSASDDNNIETYNGNL